MSPRKKALGLVLLQSSHGAKLSQAVRFNDYCENFAAGMPPPGSLCWTVASNNSTPRQQSNISGRDLVEKQKKKDNCQFVYDGTQKSLICLYYVAKKAGKRNYNRVFQTRVKTHQIGETFPLTENNYRLSFGLTPI